MKYNKIIKVKTMKKQKNLIYLISGKIDYNKNRKRKTERDRDRENEYKYLCFMHDG